MWDNNGDWTEERSQYYDEEGEEGYRRQLAAITAAAAHLEARKGKGKGKNKKGKGKGSGNKGRERFQCHEPSRRSPDPHARRIKAALHLQ